MVVKYPRRAKQALYAPQRLPKGQLPDWVKSPNQKEELGRGLSEKRLTEPSI